MRDFHMPYEFCFHGAGGYLFLEPTRPADCASMVCLPGKKLASANARCTPSQSVANPACCAGSGCEVALRSIEGKLWNAQRQAPIPRFGSSINIDGSIISNCSAPVNLSQWQEMPAASCYKEGNIRLERFDVAVTTCPHEQVGQLE